MKKIMEFVRKNSLTVLSVVAMVVAVGGVSTASFFSSHQPECPKELLK
ncbi:AgrD family cyclic lactone autoinducer peptide [Petroclostridium sp. X23]|nr:cyclic lactone autoinducer peptide [Petroclostridium sp. X23]WHH57091.1 cyclic lactone autoinducer peptide [Petroclostridium sp. X23]